MIVSRFVLVLDIKEPERNDHKYEDHAKLDNEESSPSNEIAKDQVGY